MRQLTVIDPESRSADIVEENLMRLQSIFPEAFAEGKVDFEVLKQLLGGAVEETEGPGIPQQPPDSVQNSFGRVRRGGRHLEGCEDTVGQENQVGEGASRIYSENGG